MRQFTNQKACEKVPLIFGLPLKTAAFLGGLLLVCACIPAVTFSSWGVLLAIGLFLLVAFLVSKGGGTSENWLSGFQPNFPSGFEDEPLPESINND